jgi:chromosome segregation ATPase
MVDHHSSEPSGAEAPHDDSPPSVLPSAAGPTLDRRVEAVERAVRQVATILTEHLPDRLRQETTTQRAQLQDLARELGVAFRTLRQEAGSLREGVTEEVAAVEGRVGRSIGDGLGTLEAELGERLDRAEGRLVETTAGVRTEVEAVRGELEALRPDLGALRGDLEALRTAVARVGTEVEALQAMPDRLAEGMAAVREAVGDVASAHASVDERLEEVQASASGEVIRARIDDTTEAVAGRMGEAMGELRGEVHGDLSRLQDRLAELAEAVDRVRADSERHASGLQTGLERVDNLAEAVETIGRRRSFKHVVASDERLRQEQVAMTDQLSEAGEGLTARLTEIKEELEELRRTARDAQAGVLAEEIRRRVVDELVTEDMVKTMVEQAGESFERRLDELAARVDARLDEAVPPRPVRRRLFRREREQT